MLSTGVFQAVSVAATVHTRSQEKPELGEEVDGDLEETLGPVTELAVANVFSCNVCPQNYILLSPDIICPLGVCWPHNVGEHLSMVP